ncbi:conserved hypothetical protein [Ignisphaera aggregans DSM 17230]|uniref:Antitoxin SocA-like Panacea domain-containing protein n=1 Tax=Ignisphaera aggregans (strain DSM 17230 / JCM 13409 / AQ1.S1) TaxID=583356 RepID=E0STB7_IGNAA|nr:conserved hypothetical protein [Ignisphaera aggregans DSM 17230]
MLRDVVLYLVSLFPRGAGRTRIMKLLFLVDAEARKRLGYTVTGVNWRRWFYGPFSRDVLEVLDELVWEGRLAVDSGPEVRYIALDEPPKLPHEIKEIVDEVVNNYGFTPLRELLKRVYDEYGVEKIGLGEKIEFDWDKEIIELVELVNSDEDAVVELIGRLYDEYRDALEVLPRNILALYSIAVSHLSSHNPEKAKDLTQRFVELLKELSKYVNKNTKASSIPPVLRHRMKAIYEELIDIAARAVEG